MVVLAVVVVEAREVELHLQEKQLLELPIQAVAVAVVDLLQAPLLAKMVALVSLLFVILIHLH
jgi:hypothetical protein